MDEQYIDLSATDEIVELELEAVAGEVTIYSGFGNVYSHTLSQVDIDNKFIIVSDLSTVADKQKILIFVENVGIGIEYGIDYSIVEGNKIIWSGLELESKLQLSDKIKVYY